REAVRRMGRLLATATSMPAAAPAGTIQSTTRTYAVTHGALNACSFRLHAFIPVRMVARCPAERYFVPATMKRTESRNLSLEDVCRTTLTRLIVKDHGCTFQPAGERRKSPCTRGRCLD